MAVQDEVSWLLGIIKSSWPGMSFPSNLARVNRDEPKTIYSDDTEERQVAASLDRYNTVGVSKGSVNREVFGTKPQYRVTTVLDVRVEAKADEEWGETTDINGFEELVRYVQEAVNSNIVYPDVDESPSDTTGVIQYQDARVIDEQPLSSAYKDQYRTDFGVQLTGNQDTP